MAALLFLVNAVWICDGYSVSLLYKLCKSAYDSTSAPCSKGDSNTAKNQSLHAWSLMLLVPIAVRCHPLVLLYTDRSFGIFPSVYTPYGYLAVPDQQDVELLPASPGAL